MVSMNGEPKLLEVVGAFRPRRRLTNLLDGRQQQPDEHCDDGDDDQQLDQREAARTPRVSGHDGCVPAKKGRRMRFCLRWVYTTPPRAGLSRIKRRGRTPGAVSRIQPSWRLSHPEVFSAAGVDTLVPAAPIGHDSCRVVTWLKSLTASRLRSDIQRRDTKTGVPPT